MFLQIVKQLVLEMWWIILTVELLVFELMLFGMRDLFASTIVPYTDEHMLNVNLKVLFDTPIE